MKTYTCIVVDDEPLARKVLQDYIALIPTLKLVASCKNASEAISCLHEHVIDIVFCDIQMPGIDGLTFLKSLTKTPKVIITSAFSEFAIDGFNIGVVDYLLKPISAERFLLALNRAIGYKSEQEVDTDKRIDEFMFFKAGNSTERVFLMNIDFIEAYGNYTKLHLVDTDRLLLTNHKISELEKSLQPYQFIRVHKSYLINVNAVTRITSTEVRLNNIAIPIGDSFKSNVLQVLKKG